MGSCFEESIVRNMIVQSNFNFNTYWRDMPLFYLKRHGICWLHVCMDEVHVGPEHTWKQPAWLPGGRSHAPDVCHMDRNSRRQLYRTYAEVVQWVLCVREGSTCLAIRLEGAMWQPSKPWVHGWCFGPMVHGIFFKYPDLLPSNAQTTAYKMYYTVTCLLFMETRYMLTGATNFCPHLK